jgi:hypothetical protein
MERARTAAEIVERAKEQQVAERVVTLEGDGPLVKATKRWEFFYISPMNFDPNQCSMLTILKI